MTDNRLASPAEIMDEQQALIVDLSRAVEIALAELYRLEGAAKPDDRQAIGAAIELVEELV